MTMIPRALNAPLSWIGLMRVSEHEAVAAENAALRKKITFVESLSEKDFEKLCKAQDKHDSLIDKLIAVRDERDKLQAENKALIDLDYGNSIVIDDKSGQIDRLEDVIRRSHGTITQLRDEADSLRPDALLWRAARLKRRGNK